MSEGRWAGSVAVSVGRGGGCVVNVCDCRAGWRAWVSLMGGNGRIVGRQCGKGGGWGLWPSALAVGVGVCVVLWSAAGVYTNRAGVCGRQRWPSALAVGLGVS